MTFNTKPTTAVSGGSHPFPDRIDIKAAIAKDYQALDFVLPGLPPHALGLLIGSGGAGKSTLAMTLAASVALGRDLLGLWEAREDPAVAEGCVLYISAEEPAETLTRKIKALGKHLDKDDVEKLDRNLELWPYASQSLSIITKGKGKIRLSTAFGSLKKKIQALPRKPRLIIFDTLNRCLGTANENLASDVSAIVTALEGLAKPTQGAVLLVHHASRGGAKGTRGLEASAARGSSALTDNARFVLNLQRLSEAEAEKLGVPEERRSRFVALAGSKCNYAECLPKTWLQIGDHGAIHRADRLP